VQVKNPQTGEVLELRGGQWVPVGQVPVKPDEAAAAKPERLSTGAIDAAMVGAGDTLSTWGRNARDLWAGLRGDEDAQRQIADERAEAALIRDRLHGEAPVAAAVGSMLPGLATLPMGMGIGAGRLGVLGADIAAGGTGRLATNAAIAGGTGAAGSQSGELGADALEGLGMMGGGMLASNMVSRVRAGRAAMMEARAGQQAAQEAGRGLDEGQQGVIDGARRAGLQVTPGQALNDPVMRQVEASASSNPVLAPFWQAMKQDNAQQINRLTARAMGVEADNVGPQVRATAEDQIGRAFRQVGNDIGVVPTQGLYGTLQAIAAEEATAGLPTREAWRVLKQFEKGMEGRAGAAAGEAGDVMHGSDLVKMRSSVSKQMRDAYAANKSERGEVLGQVLDAIDDTIGKAALKSGSPSLVHTYDTAREQWSVLRAMDRGGATIDGQVLPGQTARILRSSDKTGFWGRADEAGQTLQRTGTGTLGQDTLGDLYDGLRFASSQIGRDIVGDSGTATRMATSGLFEGGLAATAGRMASLAARKAVVGPLAARYMAASPEAAQAWQAAAQRSAMAGWTAGNQAGAAAARGGSAILSGAEAGPYIPPSEYEPPGGGGP